MKNVHFKNANGQNITMAAAIYYPEVFDESKRYPAIKGVSTLFFMSWYIRIWFVAAKKGTDPF